MKNFYLPLVAVVFSLTAHAQQTIPQPELKKGKPSFTENKGQVADQHGKVRSDVRFIVANGGIKIFIADNGLHYQWQKMDALADEKTDPANAKSESYRIDVNLLNALSAPEVISEGPSDYYTNYYLGHCPQGITHVRNYNKVTLRNVYRNIDWVFYMNDGNVEYDFLVHPGGNPADIAMQIEGATGLKISETGSLVLTSPLGSCEQLAPVAYQNGKAVASKFVLKNNILRLAVDDYNPALALNIDPVIKIWGTYYGGALIEKVGDLKTDNFGNVYMGGSTSSVSAISSGGHQNTYAGGAWDGFLVKFDGAGNRLWATYYGGASDDMVAGCATDANGNVFISGTTASETAIAFNGFKNSINSYPLNSFGTDAFLVKFNSSGVRQWGTYVGAAQANYFVGGTWDRTEVGDVGYSCATDLNGNVYLAGVSAPLGVSNCWDSLGNPLPCQNTYIATSGAYQDTTSPLFSYANGFLVKFNSNGSRLWGTYYGCGETGYYFSNPDQVFCATDRAGNPYLAGTTNSDYDGPSFGFNGHQNTMGQSSDTTDCWLVKFDPNGATRLWGTYYGGRKFEKLSGLCTDSVGNVFIQGNTSSPNTGNVIATAGTFRSNPLSNEENPFLAKFNSAGVRQWGTFMGDVSQQQLGGKCAADNNGNVITTFRGQFVSSNSGWVASCGSTGTPQYGIAITRFKANGTRDWAEVYKSDNYFKSVSCAVSPNGKSIYLGDSYTSTNANVPLNALQDTVNGGEDAYLICFRDTAVFDTLCGHVFDDVNGNGVKEPGESYLVNAEVYMSVPQGVQTYSGFTDTSGFYQVILPRWGTSGLCNTPLYVNRPFGKVVSIPLAGSYPQTILGNSPGCIYDFGLSPSISVSGKVYYDTNRGGTLTSGEPGIPRQSVSFNAQRQSYTDGNGDYFALIPVGNYTETFDKLDAYSTSTSNPANYIINGTTPGSTFTSKNFGAYFTPSFINSAVDIWQWGIPPVVGQSCTWSVKVSNVGTLPTSDTLIFHYDPLLVYTGGSTMVDTIAHTVTIITGNIVPARSSQYSFGFFVPPTVPPGTILHNWTWVSPTLQPDTNLVNNRDDDFRVVLASYDPNNKVAETNTPDPTEHLARYWSNGDDYIRYVINFQNTGTYTAFNVVINDTLPAQLDPTTVEVLTASHTCVTNRSGNTLNFKFSSINLPDSATDEPGSKGYVVFKVKPTTAALPGDSIVNHAAIYFDYNSAVITDNSVVNLVTSGGPCTAFITAHKYDTVCSFTQPYIFEGRAITAVGNYTGDTLTMALGCDSVTILHLAYKLINTGICQGQQFCSLGGTVFNGQVITAPGLYRDTILSASGCDSVICRSFQSATTLTTTVRDTMCSMDPYVFNDTTIYYPGYNPFSPITVRDTLQSVGGCDSIVTLFLYVRLKTGYLTDTICGLEPYVIAGDTFYAEDYLSGSYSYNNSTHYIHAYLRDTVRLPDGCDSLVQVNLYIKYGSYIRRFFDASQPCGLSGNGTRTPHYTAPHIEYAQQNNFSGCPDIVITYYELPSMSFTRVQICPGDSFYFNNKWRKSTSLYYDTLTAACGDDSLVTLYLVVNNSYYPFSTYHYLCPDSTFIFRGVTYSQPGSYTQIDSSSACMDTVYRIYIYDPYAADTVVTYELCPGTRFSYNDSVIIYQQPFSYYDTVSYYEQCTEDPDSIIETIRRWDVISDTSCVLGAEFDSLYFPNCHDPNSGYLRVRAWGGTPPYTYRWTTGDTSQSLSNLTFGNYRVVVYDAAGDSTMPYYGWYNGRYAYMVGYTTFFLGETFSKDNTFDSLPTVIYNVTHAPVCYQENTDTSAIHINWYGAPYIISNGVYTDTIMDDWWWYYGYGSSHHLGTGNHSFTLTNSYGCVHSFEIYIPGDKMEFIQETPGLCSDTLFDVVIKYTDYDWTNPLIQLNIAGFTPRTYNDYNGTDTLRNLSAGYYPYTVTNARGCAKTDTFLIVSNPSNLTVALFDHPVAPCSNQHLLSVTASSGVPPYNFLWSNGSINDSVSINQPGTYSVRVSDASGCSITNSVVIQPAVTVTNSIAASICANQSYNFNNTSITAAGIYTDTLQANSGCDSIVTLNLSTLAISSASVSASVCQGDVYSFNGQSLTQSGTYSATLANSNGCDSTVTLSLSILPNAGSSSSISVCADSSYNFHGQIINQTGTYTAQLIAGNGCDSVVTLNFTSLAPLVPTITRVGDTLFASAASGYQWYLGNNPVAGATGNFLLITQNGQYHIAVTDSNGCSENSASFNVTGVGIAAIEKDLFARVFPNPATEQIIIETNFIKPLISIQSLQGQLINEFYGVKQATTIDVTHLASAVYIVKIKSSEKTITIRFVKE